MGFRGACNSPPTVGGKAPPRRICGLPLHVLCESAFESSTKKRLFTVRLPYSGEAVPLCLQDVLRKDVSAKIMQTAAEQLQEIEAENDAR